jgi:hypothetical protein
MEDDMNKMMLKAITMLSLFITMAAASSFARTNEKLFFYVPFNFTVGSTNLPAGQYTIEPIGIARLIIRNADGDAIGTAVTVNVQSSTTQKQSQLMFRRYGNQYFLAQIWTEGDNQGRELIQSQIEQELSKSTPKIRTTSIVAHRR